MRNLLISFALLLIAVNSAQAQSLRSISGNEFVLKDTEYSQNIKSSQKKKSEFAKGKKAGDYISICSGLFIATEEVSRNHVFPYVLTDININIYELLYLDLGAGAYFSSEYSGFACQAALGFAYDLIPDRFFIFAGAGVTLLFPYALTEFMMLRLNYKFTKDLSVGLDNKFFGFGKTGDNLEHRYSIGLNFSHRFNYK